LCIMVATLRSNTTISKILAAHGCQPTAAYEYKIATKTGAL
jgi:hypothetical protein